MLTIVPNTSSPADSSDSSFRTLLVSPDMKDRIGVLAYRATRLVQSREFRVWNETYCNILDRNLHMHGTHARPRKLLATLNGVQAPNYEITMYKRELDDFLIEKTNCPLGMERLVLKWLHNGIKPTDKEATVLDIYWGAIDWKKNDKFGRDVLVPRTESSKARQDNAYPDISAQVVDYRENGRFLAEFNHAYQNIINQ